jgi:hypothetical protein
LNNKEGLPHHAMCWNGERDVNHEPLLMGFNGNEVVDANKNMSYKADGNMRTGAIIDIGRMIEDCNPQKIRQACRDIYHASVAGLMSEKDEKDLESLFMQTTGKYKMHGPQSLENEELGNSDPRLKNIVNELCKGDFPANQQIKAFLLEKGYATENNGNIELTEKLTLQSAKTPATNAKTGDTGKALIKIGSITLEKGDNYIYWTLGHELCHLMVNDKMPNATTAPEVEALCNIVGQVAAKGAGYDPLTDKNKNPDFESQFRQHFPDASDEEITQKVKRQKEIYSQMYMPGKLLKIDKFIAEKIPSRSDFWVQHAQKKLDDRKKASSPQSTTPERKPSSGNVTKHSLSQGVNR